MPMMTAGNYQPLITTNGMFIIDEIIDRKGKIHQNVAGGGGMFAMLGGCIVSPNRRVAGSLRWIVDCGYDFPKILKERIESWQSGVVFREDLTRETTRGWNGYGDDDLRQFKYLNEKRSITAADWREFGMDNILKIECVHLICSGERCSSLIKQMKGLECYPKVIVWEPVPDLCDKAHFADISGILQLQDDYTVIFSPNAEEGARLLGDKEPFTVEEVVQCIWKFDKILSDRHVCVLRCGRLGSVMLTSRDNDTGKRTLKRFPAYHEDDISKVIDPTGGGNAFLGGFCVGYTATANLDLANICGHIAAGCVIEQMGVPEFNPATREWNGLTLVQRLDRYLKRNPSLVLHKSDQICRLLSNRWE
ncbi:hypothetical protein HG537_0H03220 [Torulaspora globosa]|uniref:Carbohydrate kinase PfkB domain-containing protein n=1 Tax=Torulaspora globosa TaxID=48254 RepID=A0A7H9HZJ4_9SACH|nr:hypothetical protein HG537_0H03220 [Torulaspora sp. CBS 2947]